MRDFNFNFKPKSFNSYKGTIVILSASLEPYTFLDSFNSYKGTIVIDEVGNIKGLSQKLQFL